MKKVIVVLLVIVIAAGILYYLYLPKPVKPITMLVPRDACLFFGVREGEILWNKVEASRWFKSVSTMEGLARTREALRAAAERQALKLGLDLDREHLIGLLGEEVGVALVPGVKSGGTLLFLARDGSSFPSTVMKNLESSGLYKCESSKYERAKMLLLRSPDAREPLRGVCRIGDILALAVSTEDPLAVLRQVVDLVHSRGEGSLRQSDRFQKVMAISGHPPECSAGIYFDFSGVEEGDALFSGDTGAPPLMAGDVDLSQLEVVKKSLIQSLKRMEAGGGILRLAGGLEATLYYIPDKSRMDEPSLDMLRIEPKRLKILKLIPSGQLLYSASLCGGARELWQSFVLSLQQTNPGLSPVVDGTIGKWENETGVSFENDVLPLVGDELGYCLGAPGAAQLLPLPSLGLILKVKDAEKAKGLMSGVIRSLMADEGPVAAGEAPAAEPDLAPAPETEQYEGHTMTVIPTGLLGFRPVYTFLGNFIVATSDSALMREIIDVWSGRKESVRASALYGSLCDEYGEDANSVTFIDMGELVSYLRDLSQVVSSLMNLAAEESGRKTDFAPFLESMEVLRYIYSKTETSEEVIKQIIFVDIEDLRE